jgi:hypothetical protein
MFGQRILGALRARLNFWRRPVVINPGTVNKRLTISLLLCVLALAIVSTRMDSLRRVVMAADSTTNVHQPRGYLIQFGFTGKFLVPEILQDEFNLQKLAPTSFQSAVGLFPDSWHLPRLQSNTFPKPPPYIVLSVLNL